MGNLSQKEIDALLSGGVVDSDESQDMSNVDISIYLNEYEEKSGNPVEQDDLEAIDRSLQEDISQYFNASEVDALGEVGNICIGTSATIMYKLLGRRVSITTPKVALYKPENALATYTCPFLAVNVEFTEGLYGKNLLILKDYDAALITDLLMGGEGEVEHGDVILNEIHFSAMSELMNQMMGSAATAMSKMMDGGVNISPPEVSRMEADENIAKFLDNATPIVKISFDMEIEGLLKSNLIQIMSIEMAKDLIYLLTQGALSYEPVTTQPAQPVPANNPVPAAPSAPAYVPPVAPSAPSYAQAPSTASPRAMSNNSNHAKPAPQIKEIKPAHFQSFDEPENEESNTSGNFDLINDIPLQVTVELGKSKKSLAEVLNMGVGSIVVLDKQAGELVDVIVNGKRIAKGEVVIIEENYGVRITEIIK